MKKAISLLLLIAVLVSLAACGSAPQEQANSEPEAGGVISTPYGDLPADGPEIELVIASDAVETSIHNQAVEKYAKIIQEATQGKITLTNYPNAQLGSDTELLNSLVAGDIDLDLMSGALASSLVPEAALFNIPFLNDADSLDAVIKTMIDSDFREEFDTYYEQAGLKLLVLSIGQSWELNTRKQVTSLDEIKGLKIRTPQSDSYMAIWEALGANPTPLAYGELYTALQQGLVDGNDQMLSNILQVKFYEQAPYIMMTNHNYGSFTILMNLDKFNALPAEYQTVLENIGDELSEYLSNAFLDGAAGDRAALEDLGVTFYDLSETEVAALKEAGAAGIEKVEAMVQNDALIELYKETVNANK